MVSGRFQVICFAVAGVVVSGEQESFLIGLIILVDWLIG